MGVCTRFLGTALAAITLLCALPSATLASHTQTSVMMDDVQFIYASPRHVVRALEAAKALGVDQIKVSVVWSLLAPKPNSHRRPNFDARNPAAYPRGVWARWDRIVTYAAALGMKVYFQIVPPAPVWATPRKPPKVGYSFSQNPNPAQFGQFVYAVGRRYSGHYVLPSRTPAPSAVGFNLTLPGGTPSGGHANPPIPRVTTWGICNEPNEVGWLSPQLRSVDHTRVDASPALYRRLVDYGYSALAQTGHGADTILLGEIASKGWVFPVPFVREMYCVDARDQPLRGLAASQLGCPTSGNRARFTRTHPGLFATHAFALHPYSFDQPPSIPKPNPDWITLANLGHLGSTLDRIYATYGRQSSRRTALYLTEWGYKSNPPNPYVHTSLSQQATWLNQGEFLAWESPRVRTLAQFLLIDSTPRAGAHRGSRSYWSTFQTGLMFTNGRPKPSYWAYRLPIWVPHPHPGSRVTVWGELRQANHRHRQHGTLQYRRLGARGWDNSRSFQTSSGEGFFLTHVALPAAGSLRLAWRAPSGQTEHSRIVPIG